MVGLAKNKANSALLELKLGLSLTIITEIVAINIIASRLSERPLTAMLTLVQIKMTKRKNKKGPFPSFHQ